MDRQGTMLTSKIEVYQGLSKWGGGGREEMNTGIPDMGAVAEVQGAQLGRVAQQESQGGVCQLEACQAQLCHPLQPPTALRLPWAGRQKVSTPLCFYSCTQAPDQLCLQPCIPHPQICSHCFHGNQGDKSAPIIGELRLGLALVLISSGHRSYCLLSEACHDYST